MTQENITPKEVWVEYKVNGTGDICSILLGIPDWPKIYGDVTEDTDGNFKACPGPILIIADKKYGFDCFYDVLEKRYIPAGTGLCKGCNIIRSNLRLNPKYNPIYNPKVSSSKSTCNRDEGRGVPALI